MNDAQTAHPRSSTHDRPRALEPGPIHPGVSSEAKLALAVVGAMTLLRLVMLFVANHTLAPDEALYWSWGQEPAFGYFEKPPLVAWLIGATTGLFGNTEWGVRIAAPLLHGATALAVFAVARRLADDRIALWSAVIYATAPAVSFSSGVMTTDVPLLFFWTTGLLLLLEVLRTRSLAWAAALGVVIGLGILSKYAMVYFLACTALFLAVSPGDRWLATSRCALVTLGIAALILTPNLLYNAANDFATIRHTAANTNLGAEMFRFGKFLEFFGAQFGVFGPLMFAALIARVATLRRAELDRSTRFLVAFSVPLVVLLCVQAFLSRAHANWAVPAYVAATILVVAWLSTAARRWRWVLPASVGLHLTAAVVLAVLVIRPDLAPRVGLGHAFAPVRGWDKIGERVADVVAAGVDGAPFTAILTNDSKLHGEILFYAHGRLPPAAMWDYDGIPQNHYELASPLTAGIGQRVLFVARYGPEAHIEVRERFKRSRLLEVLEVPEAGHRARPLYLYALEDFQGV